MIDSNDSDGNDNKNNYENDDDYGYRRQFQVTDQQIEKEPFST